MTRKILVIMVVIFSSCTSIAYYREAIDVKRWFEHTSKEIKEKGSFLTDDCTIIPLEYQDKYISYLNRDTFIIIDNTEYKLMFGKYPNKKYAIAFRAIAHSQLEGNKLAYNFHVEIFGNGDYIVSAELMPIHPAVIKFRKVVLVIEVDKLPERVIADSYYKILQASSKYF